MKGGIILGLMFVAIEPQNDQKTALLSDIAKIAVTSSETLPQIDDETQLMTLSPALPIDLSPKNREQWLLAPEKKAEESSYNQKKFENRSIPWLKILLFFSVVIFSAAIKKMGVIQKLRQLKAVDPLTTTLKALENLQHEILLAQENVSDHYTTLTKIIRDFLEDYYHIKAKADATEELLLDQTFQHTFDRDKEIILQKILLKADAIKFGCQPISSLECTEDINSIKEILTALLTR
jgi:hypothetical protein